MSQQKPLLVLFDGNALVHRAFHALPPLTVAKTGEMVNAVYGFASMVLKVLKDLSPTHYAAAFDYPAPTFRHERFADYKAQRPKAPEDLRSQFGKVKELLAALNLPVFEVQGYEADDILGALSRQASVIGVDTIIVTGDADAMQLVSPRVRLLTPGRSFSETRLYDEAAVVEKYGVPPRYIADLKGLEGDPSDNIPGVPGIGGKTAARLIQQFGNLEQVYAHLDEVKPDRIRETLAASHDQAEQSKQLATIVTDVPVQLDLDACKIGGFVRERLTELFRELEFFSLLPRLNELLSREVPAGLPSPEKIETNPELSCHVIDTPEAFEALIKKLLAGSSFVVALKTTGEAAMSTGVVGISVSYQPGEAYYIPVGHRAQLTTRQLPVPQVVAGLKPLLQNSAITKITHNGKFSMIVLAEQGVALENLSFDTMIAAHLLGEKSLTLQALAFGRLGIEMSPVADLLGKGSKKIPLADVDIHRLAEYACADAAMTLSLNSLLEKGLKEQNLWPLFTQVEIPLVSVLAQMETDGVALDVGLLRRMSVELGQQVQKLEADIYSFVGHDFNINSPQQLATVLFDQLKLPGGRKTKSGYSTEAAVLEGLRDIHPIVAKIMDYRQLTKLKSTYIDALPELVNPRTGRVHTTFNQTATATGRLSSSDPNLQNVPIRGELGRQIRQAFIAVPPNMLLAADYSQIDLRALAHLSQDERLLAAFRQDEDIHSATAAQVFGVALDGVTPDMRRVAKTVNFGVIYGMSGYGLEQATEFSREQAAGFIRAYFEKYPGVKQYLEATKLQARSAGYVQTLLGRRRYIPEINTANRVVREAAERMAINMPVQGTSADIIKVAMINLHRQMRQRGLKSKMILQVHDELVFEVPPEEVEEISRLVREVMTRAVEISVPLKVDVKTGKTWGEME